MKVHLRPLARVVRTSGAGLIRGTSGVVTLGLPVAFALAVIVLRGTPAQAGATPAKTLVAAGALLQSAMAPKGSGFNFFAVQRTTEYARPNGPAINVVDPSDDRRVIGQTDQLFVNAMMSKGYVRPDGFFMEMRLGSPTSGQADFASAPPTFSVLARDGATWRNDGFGWYQATELPGMGIDFITLGKVPGAFGHVSGVTQSGTETVNGVATTTYSGTLTPADYPGAVAADGAKFTDPLIRFKVWISSDGRPVQLWIRARNTNQPVYDLISETTVTFDLSPAPSLPAAVPTMAPDSPPGSGWSGSAAPVL